MNDTARVLVVDDDPIARMVIEGHLAGAGMAVTSVASVDEALLSLRRDGLPDVVLADVMMPQRDGFELCAEVRTDDALAGLPFVFLTAMGDRASRLRALDAGADELLSKPIDEVELLARVRSLVRLARTRAELSGHRRFAAVLDSAGEGIATLDRDGHVVDANAAARRLLGFGDDATGWRLAEAMRGLEPVRSEQRDGADHLVVKRGAVAGGEDLYLAITRRPVTEPGAVHQVLVVRDVTGEERSRYAGELVLNSIVHKFRTPLTGLMGALEVLDRTGLTDTQTALVGIVRSSGSRLDSALRRVLEYADHTISGRAGGTAILRPEEPASLVPLVEESLRPVVSNATVELDEPVSVHADVLSLALTELVANAIESAGPEGVSIELTGSVSGVQLVVADEGAGIPPEDVDRVFERFFQVDRTGQAQGLGLGLPLVQHAVEQVGGSITLVSLPSGPTRVRVVLPAVRPATAEVAP